MCTSALIDQTCAPAVIHSDSVDRAFERRIAFSSRRESSVEVGVWLGFS